MSSAALARHVEDGQLNILICNYFNIVVMYVSVVFNTWFLSLY